MVTRARPDGLPARAARVLALGCLALTCLALATTASARAATPGITVAAFASVQLDERDPGITDTYTVTLDTQPTADVTILVAPDVQVEASPPLLLFTPDDWYVPHVVTVSAVPDGDPEGAHFGTVWHTAGSDDPDYDGMPIDPVMVDVVDGDLPGLEVDAPDLLELVEGEAPATVRVRLLTEPSDVVTVVPDAGAQLTVGPSRDLPLQFTADSWYTWQEVEVGALADAMVESSPHMGSLGLDATSLDLDYDGMSAPSIAAEIVDKDVAGLVFEPDGGPTSVAEAGDGAQITVRLASRPIEPVTIRIPAAAGQVTVYPSTVTIQPDDWDTSVSLAVSAVQDQIVEASHRATLRPVVESADGTYAAVTPSGIVVEIADDDVASLVVTPTAAGHRVVEGGASDTVAIALGAPPAGAVRITLAGGPQVRATPASFVVTPGDWNRRRTVAITALDDDVDEEDPHLAAVTIDVAGTAPGYATLDVEPLAVTVVDDDRSAVVVAHTRGSTALLEGGAGDAVAVRLATRPSANVEVRLTGDAQVRGPAGVVVFTPRNWARAQAAELVAIDDQAVEGRHAGVVTVAIEGDDPRYAELESAPVKVRIDDDDRHVADGAGADAGDDSGAGGGAPAPRSSAPVPRSGAPVPRSGAPVPRSSATSGTRSRAGTPRSTSPPAASGTDARSERSGSTSGEEAAGDGSAPAKADGGATGGSTARGGSAREVLVEPAADRRGAVDRNEGSSLLDRARGLLHRYRDLLLAIAAPLLAVGGGVAWFLRRDPLRTAGRGTTDGGDVTRLDRPASSGPAAGGTDDDEDEPRLRRGA